jgi:hypothetical protein
MLPLPRAAFALIALSLGCARTAEPPTGDTTPDDTTTVAVETAAPADSDPSVDPSQLYGTPPDAPIALPDFQAVNEHGELRDRTALLGHPTVMWFFPLSGTPG